eukprot:TRINITY_DN19890_c0_g1_i1.p1 TRINITY_DN19890_c0_g1~~TRINITY_DN19890_c0_g1_i1.p1  ORF type:complete len:624 (+),score=88.25 TRINITY_DN19890_c0_g1_i1:106-1872(+)
MANSVHSGEPPWLHVRREPFEFGLLPLPSLMQTEGISALKNLRSRLLSHGSGGTEPMTSSSSSSPDPPRRITIEAIATCLGLSEAQGRLLLETLASVLPDEGMERDPLTTAPAANVEVVGADLDHLVLFLYLQLYKRLPHRTHRDASAIGDVWPSTSPFDGFAASPSSPLQLKASSPGSRNKLMPQYAEEEMHQLQFIQKHLLNMLLLLTVQSEDEGEAAKVISSEKFERLSLLLRAGGSGSAVLPLSQATPFFANSDPAMPAVPVPVSQVHEWLLRHICATSEHTQRSSGAGGGDVNMADAGPSGSSGTTSANGGPFGKDWWPDGITCIDGVTKMSVLKGEHDIADGVVRASHCHDSVVYVLSNLKFASVIGCTDSIIVLGAVAKAVKVENCERVQVIVPCARIRVANCRECVFYLGTNTSPLVLGDNHKLQVAPYNTFYPRLDAHLAMSRVDPSVNRWDSPLTLGMDPHDGLSHVGAVDAPGESAALLLPERFVPFVVPFRSGGSSAVDQPQTRANPFPLPKLYLAALQQKTKAVESLRQTLKTAVLEENKKRELTNVIQAHFKEWLFASGNIRQVYDLARLDSHP